PSTVRNTILPLRALRSALGMRSVPARVLMAIALCCCATSPLALPAEAAAAPLPLGVLTLTSDTDPSCPAGSTCQGVEVTCPSVQQPDRGFLATAQPTSPARGLVMLMSGGGGTGWWIKAGDLATQFVSGLQADGFMVVQLRWVGPWLASAPGEDAGSGHLACRPATV